MISRAQEEYLKTMYLLKKQNGNIRVTDVALKMDCTKPSVNKALNILKENKLVNYETYGTIELTDEGENLAKKILEAYEKAKLEAEKIKTNLSDDTINKLARYVHNELGLSSLNCNYDINKEKCRECAKRIQK